MVRLYTMVILCGMFISVSTDCNENTALSSGTECVSLSKYENRPQWATCLTDTVIRTKTNGKRHCMNNATQCWYECMCELNNKCDGPDVYHNCSCNPVDQHSGMYTTTSIGSTLPQWCFNPPGQTCSWYWDCLETRHPCAEIGLSYAVSYGGKFCNLFSEHYQWFSNGAKRWIDAVRKCLQVALVPILRPGYNISCQDIEKEAFTTHPKCYTNPAVGLSYCHLGLKDKLKILWTLKGALTTAFVETLKTFLNILAICADQPTDDTVYVRFKVLSTNSTTRELNMFASKVIDIIAKLQKWEDRGLSWIGYIDAAKSGTLNNTSNGILEIRAVIASKLQYYGNAPDAPKFNTSEFVMTLADSVSIGMLPLEKDGVSVRVLSMTACRDINCHSTYLDVQAPAPTILTGQP